MEVRRIFDNAVTPDEHQIIEYLKARETFVSVAEIVASIGGEGCRSTPRLAETSLLRLATRGVVEVNHKGQFRFKLPERLHLAPHIAQILAAAKG